MNFEFPDACKQIGVELRRGLERVCPLTEVRRCLESGQQSSATWSHLADVGVLAANIPEEWGGSGMGVLEAASCAQEIGRACAPVPTLASLYLATGALVDAGSDAQRSRWLPGMASGKRIGTYVTGPHALRFSGDRVHGTLPVVPIGATADFVLIEHDGSAMLVDANHDTVRRTALRSIDPGYPLATIDLDGTPFEMLEGSVDGLVDRAATLLAFEQIGGADRVLEMARTYAMQRRVFGRNVGSFQAIKHKLADVWVGNEIARGHVYFAAASVLEAPPQLRFAAAAARVAASEAYEHAAQENVQVHGGFGFTWEADCHPYYKRARASAVALGSPTAWRRRLFAELRAAKGGP